MASACVQLVSAAGWRRPTSISSGQCHSYHEYE
jgi:hypothetical protein